MSKPYSVVIIRTRQILSTGLTMTLAKAEARKWNQQSAVEDCATWEPAPAGIVCHEGLGELEIESDDGRGRDE